MSAHPALKQSIDTPGKSSSASQQGDEQTHDTLDPIISGDINGCTFKNTEGFYEKYFPEKDGQVNSDWHAGWIDYPKDRSPGNVLEWILANQANYLKDRRNVFASSHNETLAGSDCQRKSDLILVGKDATLHNGKYDWSDVLAVGELKQSSPSKHTNDDIAHHAGLAREVFARQPTRRFLHGFLIRSATMVLWVFDRSGLYSSKGFDITQDPRRFINIMDSFSQMSDSALGMDTYIKKEGNSRYIEIKKDGKQENERLYLEEKPIAFQRAIVRRGTTCYRAKRHDSQSWEYVVKFAW